MVDILNLKFNDESRSGSSPDERSYPTYLSSFGGSGLGSKKRTDKRKGRKKNNILIIEL